MLATLRAAVINCSLLRASVCMQVPARVTLHGLADPQCLTGCIRKAAAAQQARHLTGLTGM